MTRLGTVLIIFGTAAALQGAAAPAAGQAVVQRVELRVDLDGPAPHPVIRERLTATVASVADRLLAGRPLEQLAPLAPRLGETIAEVVDRVAAGYAVAAVSVELGPVTEVAARLRPVGAVIHTAGVAADLRAVHPRLHDLVRGLFREGAAAEISALYTGLPVRALEWAEPMLGDRARDAVERALAGFTAAVEIAARGEAAQATAVVAPRDTRVVRNIGVRFRSSSIPTMLLDQHGPAVASMAEPLRGLPVAFAQAHLRALAGLIAADLAAYPPARQYRVVATPALDVGETTFVTVVADSLVYRARVEAQLNIGTRAPGPAVVAHLGRLITPSTGAFVEMRLVPNTLSMEWQVGGTAVSLPRRHDRGGVRPRRRRRRRLDGAAAGTGHRPARQREPAHAHARRRGDLSVQRIPVRRAHRDVAGGLVAAPGQQSVGNAAPAREPREQGNPCALTASSRMERPARQD